MKPSFALNLTHGGIGLLHRTGSGWLSVGEVSLDAPDLAGELAALRRTALGLVPRGIISKIVIPATQVLYLSVDAPGPDAARRRAQITKALEGRTPYAAADLVFDWSGTGKTVRVAVVARETLNEAELFAEQHRFNPVSFVAIPASGEFAGEPFFGLTRSAAQYLPEGARLDRDQDPIRVLGIAAPRPPAQDAEPEPTGEPTAEPTAEPAVAPATGAIDPLVLTAADESTTASAGDTAIQDENEGADMLPETAAEPASAPPTEKAEGTASADPPQAEGAQSAPPSDTTPAPEPLAATVSDPEPGPEATAPHPPETGAEAPAAPAADAAVEVAPRAARARKKRAKPAPQVAPEADQRAKPATSRGRKGAGKAGKTDEVAAPRKRRKTVAMGEIPAASPPEPEADAVIAPPPEFTPAPMATAAEIIALVSVPEPAEPPTPEATGEDPETTPKLTFATRRTAAPAVTVLPKGLSAERDESTAPAAPIALPRVLAAAPPTKADAARPPQLGAALSAQRGGATVPDPRLKLASGGAHRATAPKVSAPAARRLLGKIPPLFPSKGASSGAARTVAKGAVGAAPGAEPLAARAPAIPVGSAARLHALAGRAAASGSAAGLSLARRLSGKSEAAGADTVATPAPNLSVAPVEPAQSAAPKIGIFGGPVGNRSRANSTYVGAALVAALIVFMGIVAVWSMFLGEPTPEATTLASSAEDATGAPQPALAPPPETAALAPEAAASAPQFEAVATEPLPAAPAAPEETAPQTLPGDTAADVDVATASSANLTPADPVADVAPPETQPETALTADPEVPATDAALAEAFALPASPDAPPEPEAVAVAALSPQSDTVVPAGDAATSQTPAEPVADAAPLTAAGGAITAPAPVATTLPELPVLPAFSPAQLATMAREAPAAADQTAALAPTAAPLAPGATPLPIVALPPAEAPAAEAPIAAASNPPAAPEGAIAARTVATEPALEPTAEGTEMPGGFTLFAGRPEPAIGPRPAEIEASARVARAAANAAIAAEVAALAAARPAPRPVAVVAATVAAPAPEAAAPAADPDALAAATAALTAAVSAPAAAPLAPALSDAERAEIAALAARKPALRPQAITAAAAAATATRAAEAERVAAGLASATPQAISVAPRPVARPRNFTAAITRALQEAAPPPADPAPAAAANGQHIEIDEPEAPAVANRGTTSATVAQQATQTNAINLSDMTLVGLFGASGARRALLRLPSGRFQTVEVGDRVDGGQVVAISETQMSYVKGGNTITLKLLQSN